MTETAPAARRRLPPHVSSTTPLTARERLFVAEYLVDLHGANAAIRAGYQPRNARAQASRLLTKANILPAVQTAFAARLQRTEIKADDVLFHLAKLAFVDLPNIRVLFDAQGHLKPMQTLTVAESAIISSCEVVTRNLGATDGRTDTLHKVRLWDPRSSQVRALELLGRHCRLFDEATAQPAYDGPAFVFTDGTTGVAVQ